tara:strand:- start:162 stop:695 length:534 start_codon:yes stop_codon:yes gene_type:complete
MKKINKNKGIVFWITGLAGSGKTTIAKKLKNKIAEKYGPTLVISGDDLRKIFKLNGFSKARRLLIGMKYASFVKKISDQKINIIIAVVAMNNSIRKWNKKNIKNYFEIFIKTNLKILKTKNKKNLYKTKLNVVGVDIKPEYPKKSDLIIKNNFRLPIYKLVEKIFLKIQKNLRENAK